MEKSIAVISQSTLSSLEKIEDQVIRLNFEQVDVGSYIKISLGFGNVLKGSIEPYFKLFFRKKKSQIFKE